jgi:hypothetical protein
MGICLGVRFAPREAPSFLKAAVFVSQNIALSEKLCLPSEVHEQANLALPDGITGLCVRQLTSRVKSLDFGGAFWLNSS